MDANGFDTLTRSLTTAGSRRGALAGFLGSALGLVGFPTDEAGAHDLLAKCKKIKDKAKRKKCLKKAKAHNTTHLIETPPPDVTCIPNCTGKGCGDDGCGGSCGGCAGGAACANGACVCPAGTEVCGGTCVSLCTGDTVRDPTTCGCCGRPHASCSAHGPDPNCCSRFCVGPGAGPPFMCTGKEEGQPCEFNGQCASAICTNGFCRCPSGQAPCAGQCFDPCPPDQTRNPNTCNCCIRDGASCASATRPCCSGFCQQFTNICRRVSEP